MDDKDHKFEKELAKVHIEATFVATVGSVVALLGITLLVFGLTTNLESNSKIGDQMKLFGYVGGAYSTSGLSMFIIGIVLLIAGRFLIPRKIDKIK